MFYNSGNIANGWIFSLDLCITVSRWWSFRISFALLFSLTKVFLSSPSIHAVVITSYYVSLLSLVSCSRANNCLNPCTNGHGQRKRTGHGAAACHMKTHFALVCVMCRRWVFIFIIIFFIRYSSNNIQNTVHWNFRPCASPSFHRAGSTVHWNNPPSHVSYRIVISCYVYWCPPSLVSNVDLSPLGL